MSDLVSKWISYLSAEKAFPIKTLCPSLSIISIMGYFSFQLIPLPPNPWQSRLQHSRGELWRLWHLGKPEKQREMEILSNSSCIPFSWLVKVHPDWNKLNLSLWTLEGKQGVCNITPSWINSKLWHMSHKVALMELSTGFSSKLKSVH